MKLKLQRNQALSPLTLVTGVVERRQTLPILANVLLESGNEALRLVGTDLEVEVLIEVPAENATPGTTTVNARKLLDICRALDAARRTGNMVSVTVGYAVTPPDTQNGGWSGILTEIIPKKDLKPLAWQGCLWDTRRYFS